MTSTPDLPVVIAGAGPVGLTTAALLARRGVPPLVVERHPGTSIFPKARGISPRAMAVLADLGVASRVRAAGRVLADNTRFLRVETLAGAELERQSMLGTDGPSYTLCPQDRLEPVLLAEALCLGATVRFNTEVTALDQDNTGVRLTVRDRHTGAVERLHAAYVVGADGGRGAVRDLLGLATTGPGPLGRHVNIHFRADLRPWVTGREFLFCHTTRPGAAGHFAPVDNRNRWQFNYAPSAGEPDSSFTPDRCAALLRAAAGVPDLPVAVDRVLHWSPALRVATHLHAARVALAGDAAHLIPAGGLGTGIADAEALAPALASAVDIDDPNPFPAYTATRLEAVRRTIDRVMPELGENGIPA